MTIPKNAGLSHLADVDSPIEHYPVKRKGQPRRLDPNQDAIDWLERETATDTEIHSVTPLDFQMQSIRALGWYSAKRAGHYPRRMFDVFQLDESSTNPVSYPSPCPDCLDFSRTWACTEHPEITWDTKRHCWIRHVNGDRTTCECTSCHERRERAAERSSGYTDGLQPPEGLYDRMSGQPLPSPGFTVRQADQEAYRGWAAFYSQAGPSDPNAGRAGYHYHFPTDRWVPDTDDDFRAGGEVGAGFFRGAEVSLPEVSADERLAAEWEPRCTGRASCNCVSCRILRYTSALPDATLTLEITSDTASVVRIEVERNDDDDTA